MTASASSDLFPASVCPPHLANSLGPREQEAGHQQAHPSLPLPVSSPVPQAHGGRRITCSSALSLSLLPGTGAAGVGSGRLCRLEGQEILGHGPAQTGPVLNSSTEWTCCNRNAKTPLIGCLHTPPTSPAPKSSSMLGGRAAVLDAFRSRACQHLPVPGGCPAPRAMEESSWLHRQLPPPSDGEQDFCSVQDVQAILKTPQWGRMDVWTLHKWEAIGPHGDLS